MPEHQPPVADCDRRAELYERPVREFFDRHAGDYERSWDTRAHGLHIGIFDGGAVDLESAYQHSREHVTGLLNRVSRLDGRARVLDVCCGTGATLAQIVDAYACSGLGVDISDAQLAAAARLRSGGRGTLQFRQGSASSIKEVVSTEVPFTHVFSQEGLLFAHDKPAALRGFFDALASGGSLVISDFVPRASREDIDAALRARVYEDVKWADGLGFQEYLDLIEASGFEVVQAELRPFDMRKTYEMLIPRAEAIAQEGDATHAFLARRYAGIVKAVDQRALSWGWFVARKP